MWEESCKWQQGADGCSFYYYRSLDDAYYHKSGEL